MAIQPITTANTNRNNNKSVALAGVVGAVGGGVARYFVPTKQEISTVINKNTVDTFVSQTASRGANRSIVKYAGIGALLTAGITKLVKSISQSKKINNQNPEYTKLNALIDAPDYACEIMWYGE